jgi:hypothetical protein
MFWNSIGLMAALEHSLCLAMAPNMLLPLLLCCHGSQVLALEMLILLLENPSDDSVEMAVEFCKEVRQQQRCYQ